VTRFSGKSTKTEELGATGVLTISHCQRYRSILSFKPKGAIA